MLNGNEVDQRTFKKVRKRAIIIQAIQIDEEFTVETLEGTMKGKPGDFLMIGVDGERYPCAKEIFFKTYDFVEE